MAVIAEDVWLSPKILPVVCVNTLSLIMLFVEWTPLSFEVEHVEVVIFLHLVDQPSLQILGAVSK
jgi:hypothetical protein